VLTVHASPPTPEDERISALHDYVIALERQLKPFAANDTGEEAG
jgi:hypothetical protein